MPTKWYQARVTNIIQESLTVRRFFLDMGEAFDFIPGQFITMDLPTGKKRLDRWKSYSIASTPSGNLIELCIVLVPDGKGTNYLFNEISVGSILKCKGPGGNFVRPRQTPKELICICTGTGIAPFRSMIQSWITNEIPSYPVHLIFGTRTVEDILYHEELKLLASEHLWLSYSVALSREEYEGHQGYVHDIYTTQYKDASNDRLFMICGWQAMVDEAVQNLKDLGYPAENIIYELYG